MIEVQAASSDVASPCRIRLFPNRSLTRGQLKLAFAIIATGSLTFASLFALQGLWVPLPFAGVELVLLWLCLDLVWRRNQQRAELIAVDSQRVEVVRLGLGPRRQFKFMAAWLRVELQVDRRRWYPKRLLLRSHGKQIEIGSFLCEQEREQAAGALRQALDPVSAWSTRLGAGRQNIPNQN